ncbi:MAG: DUF3592 domain-containing protein [Planctomycetes bacterium]|nr:DUF3592 domain-containing protein [Planctomycetota bacterium]
MKKTNSLFSFLILFTLIWTGIVSIFDGFLIWGAVRREQAQSYPSTQGTITRSNIKESHDSDGSTYKAEIDFSYKVDGTFYGSDTYRYGVWSTSDHSHAQSVVNKYTTGKQVEVFYNASDPSDAILERDTQGQDLFFALFMTPFNVIMLGAWGFLASMLKRKITKPPAGGVPIQQRQGRTYLRLPRVTPLAAAGLAALGISFVSIFIVAFGLGMNPRMSTIQIVWACVLIPAVCMYFYKKFVVGSGAKDLVIDDVNGALSLPQTFGRKEDIIVSLQAVTDVSIDEIISRTKNGTSVQYEAAIVYNRDGKSIKAKLVSWGDEDRTTQFADWLRDRLGLTK